MGNKTKTTQDRKYYSYWQFLQLFSDFGEIRYERYARSTVQYLMSFVKSGEAKALLNDMGLNRITFTRM